MVYIFSYSQRDNFLPFYEKMLISRKIFLETIVSGMKLFRLSQKKIIMIGTAILSILFLQKRKPVPRHPFVFYKQQDRPCCGRILLPISGAVLTLSVRMYGNYRGSTTADTASATGRNLMLDVMKALCDCALVNGVKQIIGTYPRSRLRLYRRLGEKPSVLCSGDINGYEFCVGVLDINLLTLRRLTELRQRPF